MTLKRLHLVLRYAGWSEDEIATRLEWFRPSQWRW